MYKKDTGKRVGATAGNKEALRKYLAALHIRANEGANVQNTNSNYLYKNNVNMKQQKRTLQEAKQKLEWQYRAGVISESKYQKSLATLRKHDVLKEDAANNIQDLIKNVTNYEEFVAKLGNLVQDPKVQAFLKSGKTDGDQSDDKFIATSKAIPVKNLRPTQNEIDRDGSLKWPLTKPDSLKNCLSKGPITIKAPVVTYNGEFIIDGHHRWSQLYAINKDGQINCVDLTGPKLKPIDVLKVVQLSIAADTGKIPSATVKEGNNLLDMDGNSVAKYVTSTITKECVQVFNKMRSGALGKLDSKAIAGKVVVPNVMEMQKTSQPIPGAPKRNVMPQTDDATNAMTYLAKGVINFNKPYVAEIRKIIRKIILQEIKKRR